MKQKRFLVLSLVLGGAFLVTTAFASAASVWTTDSILVKKTSTVGTNSNKGQLLVKGFIRNPVKGKKVYVKDHLKVQGNVLVGGILQGNNIVSADNLGTGVVTDSKLGTGSVTADKLGASAVTSDKIADDAVTSDKVDMSMDGVVKAAAYVTYSGGNLSVARKFNKLVSSNDVSATRTSGGVYVIDFKTDVSGRYFQLVAVDSTNGLISTDIVSISSSNVTVQFWVNNAPTDVEGFMINVF